MKRLVCNGAAVLLVAAALSGCGGGSSSAAAGSGNSGGGAGSGGAMGQAAAARLLTQGTFGPTLDQINSAATQDYATWFAAQLALAPTHELPLVPTANSDRQVPWWTIAVTAQDQLRQRAAFAWSEILVVSENNAQLEFHSDGLASYYDQLVDNGLGNFRTLLDVVSHSPVMGNYLSYFQNDKPNAAAGVHADENYAREIMQLFTVGLWKLNADGTRQLDGSGNPIPTYGQAEVTNLARVFTGWASAPAGHTGEQAWLYDFDLLHPMVCYQNHHDTDAKTIIGGAAIPSGGSCDADMKIALDTLFNHPNVGPFVGRLLIQRLVTSNPSPAYVGRVAAAFNNNGQGVRGDLPAVVKAILTDPEATTASGAAGAGKLREPMLRLTGLWRAFAAIDAGGKIEDQITGTAQFDFGENSLLSATVFNFFRSDYQRAGPLTTAGLVAPEFQITNEFSLVTTANDLEALSYKYKDSADHACSGTENFSAGSDANTVFLHTAAYEPLASDPATLVANLNLLFMAGQMPAAMQTALTSYVAAIPASPLQCFGSDAGTGLAVRVIEATELIINSPQYAVQH